MAVTNAQRRAVYKYYRKAGYSPDEARAMRNQPLKAYEHYEEVKAFDPDRERVAMPIIPASKRSIKTAKKRLQKLGINKRTINHITRKKDEVLKITLQLERYMKALKKAPKDKAEKKAWKTLKADFKKMMKKAEFWDMISDNYDFIFGI